MEWKPSARSSQATVNRPSTLILALGHLSPQGTSVGLRYLGGAGVTPTERRQAESPPDISMCRCHHWAENLVCVPVSIAVTIARSLDGVYPLRKSPSTTVGSSSQNSRSSRKVSRVISSRLFKQSSMSQFLMATKIAASCGWPRQMGVQYAFIVGDSCCGTLPFSINAPISSMASRSSRFPRSLGKASGSDSCSCSRTTSVAA